MTSDASERVVLLKALTAPQNDGATIILYAKQGIELSKEINRPKDRLSFLMALSTGYFKSYNYPDYLNTCFEGMELSRQLKDTTTYIRFINGISLGYHSGGEDRKAISYGVDGLKLAEIKGDNRSILSLSGNIAIYYMTLKMIDSARYYDLESYQTALRNKGLNIVYPLLNLAEVEDSLHHPKEALSFFQEALGAIHNDDPFRDRNLVMAYAGIATLFGQLGQKDSALAYATKGYRMAMSDHDLELTYELASLLSTLIENSDPAESMKYYKIAVGAKDSIFSNDRAKAFQILLAKEQAREEERQKEKEREAKDRRENLQLSGIALFITFFLLSALMVSRTKTHPRVIEFMSVLSLLLVFEFVTLLSHPYIERLTDHIPLLEYLMLVGMASVLVPLHHRWTHLLKEKLLHARDKKEKVAHPEDGDDEGDAAGSMRGPAKSI